MKMRELAGVFESLEATTRRLLMSETLGAMFRQASEDEVDKVIHLLHGRLGPPFEAPDFGVAERLILRSICEATGKAPDEVEKVYKSKGDLGLVAEQFLPQEGADLSVSEVYETLREVALASGAGAQERKMALLRGLLRQLGAKEARYVVRMLQGRLRLGVGDAAIMDALSWAVAGDYELRPAIERAYNLTSDLGMVGRIMLSQGPAALDRLKSFVGKPVRAALAERLPSPEAAVTKLGKVEAEPKYDGLRLQLHKDGDKVRFFTRRLEDVSGMFPELARAALRQIKARQVIADGEAVVYNPETNEFLPFQVTVTRKRKYGIEEMETRYPLRLFVFDLLYVDGEDFTDKPFLVRREKLAQTLKWREDDPLQLTESIVTANPEELDRYFQDMVQRGLEGLVVKRPEATYQAGQRNFNWVKLKRGYQAELRDTVDLVLVGYLVGKGNRARFGIGSLLGAVYDPGNDRFRTVSKIGSGLTEEGWVEMKRLLDETSMTSRPRGVDSLIEPDVWVEPKYVVEVQADEITRSPRHTCGKVGGEPGYALRFPRLIDWIRLDKGPEDATTEQEVLEMYRMQRERTGEPPGTHQAGQRAA